MLARHVSQTRLSLLPSKLLPPFLSHDAHAVSPSFPFLPPSLPLPSKIDARSHSRSHSCHASHPKRDAHSHQHLQIPPLLCTPTAVDRNSPRDILVRAKMDTEKTFAYIIPAIESRLSYGHRTTGSLILTPTRESAIQLASHAQKLTAHQRYFEVQLLVGSPVRRWLSSPEVATTRSREDSSWDLVVATPGRLRDLLTNEPEFRPALKGCPLLVLDQADMLLSMGFRDDIDAIVSFLPRSPIRQTFLFSATMSRAVRQLASWILSPDHRFIDAVSPSQNEKHMNAVSCDDELKIHDHIEQFQTLCPTASDQLPTLLKLLAHDRLSHGSSSKVILFCPTVQTTELFSILLRSLAEKILPGDTTEIVTMHSKMKQADRDRAQVLFRTAGKIWHGRPTVLVTSDVSPRGVYYPGVTRVIQIGVPSKETMYIHRIGRVTRGVDSFLPRQGKEGRRPVVRADLLLLPWEAGYMNWRLTSLPIKSLTISALDDQLASLSCQPSTSTTEFVRSALVEIQHRIDSADVRSAAASLLGYYLPLTPSLRLQPSAVLAGVSTWASECFNVSIPLITKFPRKFTEAYEQSTLDRMKGLFVDGLKVAGASALGRAKSKNRSVWEGADTRRKHKRWY